MSPIISPWIFYFIGVGVHIQVVAGIIAGLFILGLIFILMTESKFNKKMFIFGSLFALLAVFIPGKETCYQMVAASICTPDNINTVVDGGKTLVDYIIESVNEVEEIERDVEEKEYNSRR